jgi:hypothetical protein
MAVWYVAEGPGIVPAPLAGTPLRREARCPLCLALHRSTPPTVSYCSPCAAAVARDPWLARPEIAAGEA